jgi:hypothetical protein
MTPERTELNSFALIPKAGGRMSETWSQKYEGLWLDSKTGAKPTRRM